jgi:hypothetical protein
MRPMIHAVEARTELEARHGTQESYIPPLSGVPAADRIEAFLGVRRAIAETCGDFQRAEGELAKLEAFDDRDEVPRLEVMRQAFSTTRSMMGVGPLIGHFFEVRNQALADADMGLGEYTYIYVLAYGPEIVAPSEESKLLGPHATNPRVRSALRSMLANQLAALKTAEDGPADLREALAAEIERLDGDPDRVPWQDGLPPEIVAALRPNREQLDAVFCGSTLPLELMINEKRGPAVETL